MKNKLAAFIIALLFFSCSKNETPNGPGPVPTRKSFNISQYQEMIDTAYSKMFSDSSWEKYYGRERINNVTYVTTVTSDGTKYYYTDAGHYAGYRTTSQVLHIFDQPIVPMPNVFFMDTLNRRATSFFYVGYTFVFMYEDSLVDTTASVALPFGVFSPCIVIKTRSIISTTGFADTLRYEVTMAKGPGIVRIKLENGLTGIMVRGHVNGQSWGSIAPIQSFFTRRDCQTELPIVMSAHLDAMVRRMNGSVTESRP